MHIGTLSALAEPNRLRIVEALREEPTAVGTLAKGLGLRQPQVSKHLRVLAEAGLVVAEVRAQTRVYHLKPEPLAELDGWLQSFRRLWERRYAKLDDLLAERKGSRNARKTKGSRGKRK